jgi:hypothetical protein
VAYPIPVFLNLSNKLKEDKYSDMPLNNDISFSDFLCKICGYLSIFFITKTQSTQRNILDVIPQGSLRLSVQLRQAVAKILIPTGSRFGIE